MEKRAWKKREKPGSWSGLKRHWDHILKAAAWDDAKKKQKKKILQLKKIYQILLDEWLLGGRTRNIIQIK